MLRKCYNEMNEIYLYCGIIEYTKRGDNERYNQ